MKKNYLTLLVVLCSTQLAIAQVDYATQIQPIFNNNCTSCHGSNGGVTLTSFDALMNSVGNNYGSNLVVAGNPDASGLVDKIEPNPEFPNRMPVGGALSDSEISLIRQWITEGANATATSNEEEQVDPTEFRLLGNYPNPFNPSTNIQFQVPEAVQYSISVYTVHGQLISEEVGLATIGTNTISVDMRNRPTGLYIYQLKALISGSNQVIGSGNMTLIK